MSTNRNRAKLNKAITSHDYYLIWLKFEYPPYWDEGCVFFPRYNRGTKYHEPKLYSYQIRMYKTWKHNRRTQWK